MRVRTVVAIFAAGLAAALLVAGGAAATSPPDLSSPTAINAYLTSIGVNPATAVWETGTNNYSGPSCPGKRWTCTPTSAVIVQVAPANGTNTAVESSTTGRYVVVQAGAGPTNVVNCTETTTNATATQDCNITQAGTSNVAVINEVVSSNGVSQSATQTAEVNQTANGGNNQLVLHQLVNQNTSKGSPQSENAVQTAVPVQTADGSGNNSAQVHQKQHQTATGAASSQTQNGTGATSDCTSSGFEPFNPNACAFVTQTTVSGINDTRLDQGVDQLETSTGSATTQVQGSFSGGLAASAEQCVGTFPTCASTVGTSLERVVQRKQQQQRSSGGSQTQFDPIFGGGLSQFGGTNDHQNVDQSAAQSAAGGLVDQSTDIVGSGHTPGSCTVGQTARQDEASSSISESQADCTTPLIVETSCSSFVESEGSGGSCEVTNPPPPELCPEPPCIIVFDSPTVFPSTPTFGALLNPLDLSDQALTPAT